VSSITWVALWRDMPDAALESDEIEECEDQIPRHDPGNQEKVGHAFGETHVYCFALKTGYVK